MGDHSLAQIQVFLIGLKVTDNLVQWSWPEVLIPVWCAATIFVVHLLNEFRKKLIEGNLGYGYENSSREG